MDTASTPLADYFWIAGVESISYNDPLPPPSQHVDDTIAEDGEPDATTDTLSRTSRSIAARHSRQSSGNRFSKLSLDNRMSISTLEDLDGNTQSNRSSTTIKPSQSMLSGLGIDSGTAGALTDASDVAINAKGSTATTTAGSGQLADFDFDQLLFKFAAERENFLEDLSFSAGAKVHARPPMVSPPVVNPPVNPRTERLRADEGAPAEAAGSGARLSPLRSIKGSIRRKLSFRDMNSNVRKSHGPVGRTTSTRTSRRVSSYNSVIPPPEPLNTDPDMHPLKRRFEPVLLDRYPPRTATEEVARRGRFPDYVPMFAFPNDIQIVSSDERPRSTWHGFTMTSDDGSRVYGIAVTIWTALQADIAEEVEKRCERWRQGHMSDEERELAASLGMRLAGERAHLSQLLARLPGVASGSAEREALDDQISTVEEKIALMAEMLRPLRHGAASRIDGLTSSETGLWVPRAYGILGRDATRMAFWKEWLRAVVVPMGDGAVLRVPASSPKVGRWQPLERYVVNLCTEAFSPLSSKTQVELGVRELRLYARKEAINELPGSRNTDIYALFRCLSLEHVVLLLEHALAESRIVFLSSHAAMLHLACHALASLLYPLQWASIFIPILPARLLSVLEAPCPYIVGVERRFERIDLPDDDFVLVDLDKDTVEVPDGGNQNGFSSQNGLNGQNGQNGQNNVVPSLPRQHRRKLLSLLQVAAPHRLRYGVPAGPPPYAIEAFPYDAFSAENESLFNPVAPAATLGKWVTQSSAMFGEPDPPAARRVPIFNAFVQLRNEHARAERPPTARSARTNSPPQSLSPVSTSFPPMPMAPLTPVSRSDSGFAVGATLREKRSGHFDDRSRRSSSFGVDRHPPLHRPSLQHLNGHAYSQSQSQGQGQAQGQGQYPSQNGHGPSLSISAVSIESRSSFGGGNNNGNHCGGSGGNGGYAPSTYAQSTLAASTVMPNMMVQPVSNTDTTMWVEGHCFNWTPSEASGTCAVCDERSDGDGLYCCAGCGCLAHNRCLGHVSLVCPDAFHADRVRAAFVRCMASLLYTYRKYLGRPTKEQRTKGQLYAFDAAAFTKSLPYDHHDYAAMLRNTQAFNQFIHERETHSSTDPEIRLFDEIILAKKARGRPGLGGGLSRLSTIKASHGVSSNSYSSSSFGSSFGNSSSSSTRIPPYLSDTSDHIWRTASVPVPSSKFPGEYRAVTTRVPSMLDPSLMKEPRAIQGVPRPDQRGSRNLVRKQVASMLGLQPPSKLAI